MEDVVLKINHICVFIVQYLLKSEDYNNTVTFFCHQSFCLSRGHCASEGGYSILEANSSV